MILIAALVLIVGVGLLVGTWLAMAQVEEDWRSFTELHGLHPQP